MGRPSKKPKHPRYRMEGSKALRVTLWLTRSEIDQLKNLARTLALLTPRKLPRTGIIATEFVRYGLEKQTEQRLRDEE